MYQCIESVQKILYRHTGILPPADRAIFYEKIRTFYSKHRFANCKDFTQALEKNEELLQLFLEYLLVSQSYFFREMEQFRSILEYIHTYPIATYRFLSIPCACGEEPYSLTIYLLEHNIRNFAITGIDIKRTCIDKAKKATYPARKLHLVPLDVKKRYFIQQGTSFTLKPEYTQYVHCFRKNLFDLARYPKEMFDAIICRNLFIYFDAAKKSQALDILYRLLKPNGLLLLGHADHVQNVAPFTHTLDGKYILQK